jgi:uncharacterized protein (DUF1697 family)
MTSYVALLRAVNVAGTSVAMSDLRDVCGGLRLEGTRSLLQSGNLVFRARARSGAELERKLEAAVAKLLGLETDFLVRTADEWAKIVARNPFRAEAKDDPAHLVVVCFKKAVGAAAVKALQAGITGPEVVKADGTHAYITYPDGIGRSRLTGALIEKRLDARGTARNWNTVLKLAAAVGELG